MIKTTFIYKATNSWVLKEKDKYQMPVFGCTIRSPEQWDQIFWIYSTDSLSLNLGCISHIGLPFNVLSLLYNVSWPPWIPWVQHQRHQSGLLAPKHNVSNSACKSRTFKAHYTWYSMEKIVSAMKKTSTERTPWKLENLTIEDIIFRQKMSWKPPSLNNKFLLEKMCRAVVHDYRIYYRAKQGNHVEKRLWI